MADARASATVPGPPPGVQAARSASGASGRSVLNRLLSDPAAVLGVGTVALFAAAALAAPWLAPYDPAAVDAAARLEGPGPTHLLGTDHLGRDVLSRLLHGARWSLGTVAVATTLVLGVGVLVGGVAGYVGGAVDAVLMRAVDVLLAFPGLLLALAIAGTLGPGIWSVTVGLSAVWWVEYARIVRGIVLSLRERPFVEAARALGFSRTRILFRHVLPNVVSPVVVLATLEMGEILLAVAALNFLGLGAQPPTPEWGAMVNDARPYLLTAPGLIVYPGLAISAAVLGFNLVGDGLRDALDVRL